MTAERMYHVVAINEKTGHKTYCTSYPATHDEACTMLSKFASHPARRIQLEEVNNRSALAAAEGK